MCVIQCVLSYDACDLYTIISQSCTGKGLWAEDICDYAAIDLVRSRLLIV